MANNISQFERERFLYGDAAGDGRGDLLRVQTIKLEDMSNILFSWLSGGSNEVRLPDALPITRGGTGGTTAQKGRLNLGMLVNTNNELVFGSRAISVYDGAVLDHDGTVKPGFIKNGVGDYRINGPLGFALFGFKYCLPKDDLGNVLCGAKIVFDETGLTLTTHPVVFNNGIYSLDEATKIDIPSTRCIDISVK